MVMNPSVMKQIQDSGVFHGSPRWSYDVTQTPFWNENIWEVLMTASVFRALQFESVWGDFSLYGHFRNTHFVRTSKSVNLIGMSPISNLQ